MFQPSNTQCLMTPKPLMTFTSVLLVLFQNIQNGNAIKLGLYIDAGIFMQILLNLLGHQENQCNHGSYWASWHDALWHRIS